MRGVVCGAPSLAGVRAPPLPERHDAPVAVRRVDALDARVVARPAARAAAGAARRPPRPTRTERCRRRSPSRRGRPAPRRSSARCGRGARRGRRPTTPSKGTPARGSGPRRTRARTRRPTLDARDIAARVQSPGPCRRGRRQGERRPRRPLEGRADRVHALLGGVAGSSQSATLCGTEYSLFVASSRPPHAEQVLRAVVRRRRLLEVEAVLEAPPIERRGAPAGRRRAVRSRRRSRGCRRRTTRSCRSGCWRASARRRRRRRTAAWKTAAVAAVGAEDHDPALTRRSRQTCCVAPRTAAHRRPVEGEARASASSQQPTAASRRVDQMRRWARSPPRRPRAARRAVHSVAVSTTAALIPEHGAGVGGVAQLIALGDLGLARRTRALEDAIVRRVGTARRERFARCSDATTPGVVSPVSPLLMLMIIGAFAHVDGDWIS